ncbi:MAG: hypothetical protein N3B21_09030 [Clostridia bacterium]|nr:hypothetical protein [Clostridia bacterium]
MVSETIGICATGIYEPGQFVNVEDVKLIENISEEKIKKLGIERLRVASGEEHPSDMAVKAAKHAMENGNINPEDIDIVIYTQAFFSDHLVWPDYAEVQHRIGAVNANSFKILQQCNGQVAAIDYAYSKMMADRSISTVLIVAAEKYCKPLMNRWKSANTAFWGDGASAAVIKRGVESNVIIGTSLATDGTHNRVWQASYKGGTVLPFSDEVILEKDEMVADFVRSGGVYQTDDSMRKIIVDCMISQNNRVLSKILKSAGEDVKVDKLVTVNLGINWISQAAQSLGVSIENTSAYLAKNYAHMGACDLMFNLHKMRADGRIASGDNVVLYSSGAGYSSGCVLLRYL